MENAASGDVTWHDKRLYKNFQLGKKSRFERVFSRHQFPSGTGRIPPAIHFSPAHQTTRSELKLCRNCGPPPRVSPHDVTVALQEVRAGGVQELGPIREHPLNRRLERKESRVLHQWALPVSLLFPRYYVDTRYKSDCLFSASVHPLTKWLRAVARGGSSGLGAWLGLLDSAYS